MPTPQAFTLHSPDQLGAYLRALRKARGLTQRALGEQLGVSAARISEIERDPRALGLTQLLRLIHALGSQLQLRTAEDEPAGRPSPAEPRGEW